MVTRVSGGIITDQMLAGSLRYFEIDGGVNAFADAIGDGNQRAAKAEVAAAGSGYAVNDVLTVVGGTGTAATFTVKTIGPSGEVVSVAPTTGGDYSVLPTNPVSTTVAPAGGSGATLNITEYTSLIQIPNYTENGLARYVGVNAPVPNSAAEQVLEVLSRRANIVQIALVSDDLIQVAVENTSWGWVTIDDSGPADTDLAAAIQLLGASVAVPDATATGTTVDLSAATVTEKFFSAGIA
jgi:hypothetical protein